MRETVRNMKRPRPSAASAPRALASGANSRQEAGCRKPFEELEAGPAVLHALDRAGDLFPKQIDAQLRDWIGQVTSEAPVPAFDLAALDQAFRDLSTLHLACYAYGLAPEEAAQPPLAESVVMTDRGYAFAVGRAQFCVARIACALHGQGGAQTILAAVRRERDLRRQIVEMVESPG